MGTVRELLAKAESLLTHIETARLDAELLLASALDKERSHLYAQPEAEVSEKAQTDFQSLLHKRQQGFPLAYLLGQKEFWSVELSITQDTLIPRPETEGLVELTLDLLPENHKARVLDLGTGSGAIAIAVAKERPLWEVVAVDISKAALNVAQENIRRLGLSNIELHESDWFSSLEKEVFDLILSNPPYVETADRGFSEGEIRFEPRLALDGGHQGIQAINSLIPSARQHLKEGAHLLVEHGHTQAEAIRRLFQLHHYSEIVTFQDYAGLDRISMGKTE